MDLHPSYPSGRGGCHESWPSVPGSWLIYTPQNSLYIAPGRKLKTTSKRKGSFFNQPHWVSGAAMLLILGRVCWWDLMGQNLRLRTPATVSSKLMKFFHPCTLMVNLVDVLWKKSCVTWLSWRCSGGCPSSETHKHIICAHVKTYPQMFVVSFADPDFSGWRYWKDNLIWVWKWYT